jgi:hypothetical protein
LDLARQLKASGILKADWDPTKHPRLAGRKPRQRRWRIRARRRCAERFHSWRFECAAHTGSIYNSRAARSSGRSSLSVRDLASPGSATEY